MHDKKYYTCMVHGKIKNMRDTLMVLMARRVEDVIFAERRHFSYLWGGLSIYLRYEIITVLDCKKIYFLFSSINSSKIVVSISRL